VSSPKGGFPGPLSPDLPSGPCQEAAMSEKFINFINSSGKLDYKAWDEIPKNEIFMQLANSSPQTNPEIFKEIFEKFIKPYDTFIPSSESFSNGLFLINSKCKNRFIGIDTRNSIFRLIKAFIALSKCDDMESANILRKKQKFKNDEDRICFEIAFDSIFKYRTEDCRNLCRFYSIRKDLSDSNQLNNFGNLKCYECAQVCFQSILNDIVKGKEYSETLFYLAHEAIDSLAPDKFEMIEKTKDPFKLLPFITLPGGARKYQGNFITIFFPLIGIYSLVGFLLKHDLRKLKRCPYCHIFFIAKDTKRERCYSDECRKMYERDKKRKQREKEPDIYC
jgi:hypothetical protein